MYGRCSNQHTEAVIVYVVPGIYGNIETVQCVQMDQLLATQILNIVARLSPLLDTSRQTEHVAKQKFVVQLPT